MPRTSTLRPFAGSFQTVALLVLLLANGLASSAAHALDLGDLNVPPARLQHPDGSSRWYPPVEPADTSGWDVITVSGCNLGDNGTDDEACVDNAFAAADADPTVIYFPSGTYNFTTNQTLTVERDNMVIRCQDPATTHLKFQAGSERNCALGSDAWVCFSGGGDSDTVSWLGGFDEDTVVLQVSDASAYAAGDWIVARMDTGTGCYESMNNSSFNHIARVVAVNTGANPDTITIDRPLRMDYQDDPDCGAKWVDKLEMIENVGIENCHIVHTDPESTFYRPGVAFERVAYGWATGVHMQNWGNVVVRFRGSARTMFAHGVVEDVYVKGPSGSQTVDHQRTTDSYVINNIFKTVRIASECQEGAEGIVFAHNYQVPGFVDRERSFFLHGKYCRENLAEANHVDAAPQPDSHWGRQGPRNTWYRNRHQSTPPATHTKALYFSTHKDGGPIIADQMTWIANHANWIMGGPWFPVPVEDIRQLDADKYTTNFWLEKNVAVDAFTLQTPEPTTDCGDGSGPAGCAEDPADFFGENYVGSSAPAAWNGFRIPDSLYLNAPPDWWCQEACDFGPNGIGALGDSSCRLPAQIRYEGGTCTPLSGQPPPAAPAPPVLIP
jgi:hypothetical protein